MASRLQEELQDFMAQREFTHLHYGVFRLLSGGFGNNEIANRLGISVQTVELYRNELNQRFEFEGNTMLVQVAIAVEKLNEGTVHTESAWQA